jgi:membrane dipeptidase
MFKMLFAAWLLIFGFIAFAESAASDADSFLNQAVKLMEESPLVDTHIDLPQIIRSLSN